MQDIGSLLKKHAQVGAPQRKQKHVCRDVLEKIVGVPIDERFLRIQNEVLIVSAPSPIKVRVRELKREILAEIKKVMGTHVRDIR
jgi:hypothetical protein